MLTVEKLTILLTFNSDEDLYARSGSPTEKALLADIEWDKYTSLVQDLVLVTRKLVSKEYAQDVHSRLLAACADKETAQMLIGYASTL